MYMLKLNESSKIRIFTRHPPMLHWLKAPKSRSPTTKWNMLTTHILTIIAVLDSIIPFDKAGWVRVRLGCWPCAVEIWNDIQYKLNHCTDDTWRVLSHRIDSTKHLAQLPDRLYSSSLSIFKSKWDGLHNLKYVIPTEFYHFYNNMTSK